MKMVMLLQGAGSIKITGENKPLPPKPSYPEDSEKPQNPQSKYS